MATRSRLPFLRRVAAAVRTMNRPGSPGMAERLGSLPRLLRATTSGDYRGSSVGRLALLAAAAAYVISPIDLMPEGFLSVFGLADDAMVLSWLLAAFVGETEAFLRWEQTAGTSSVYAAPGTPFTAPAGYHRAGPARPQDGDTVPGFVRR